MGCIDAMSTDNICYVSLVPQKPMKRVQTNPHPCREKKSSNSKTDRKIKSCPAGEKSPV